MTRIKTHEDFVDFVETTFEGEFEVLGEYVNSRTKLRLKHLDCDREFEVIPANFKFRKRCPLCHGKFHSNTEEYKQKVKDLVDYEYSVLGGYKYARENVEMRHEKCGHEFSMTPDSFLNSGSRCPKCAGNLKRNTEEHREEVLNLTNNEIELIGEYENSKAKTSYKHKTCGTIFDTNPQSITLSGTRCPKCSLERRSKENHYRYNPLLTEEDRMRRDMFNGELKKWREKVYERDSFKCLSCGEVGGRLNAHHIRSWDVYEEDRFSVENGATLCTSCHKGFHVEYGYGNNDETQFKSYLNNRNKLIS